jgi:hypothetical protein
MARRGFSKEKVMKLSSILCASLVALAALSLAAEGTYAASSIKSSKSNTSDKTATINTSKSNTYKLDPSDPNAEKSCTDGGGAVSTDKGGNKICTKPDDAINLNSSKSN